MTTFYYKNDKKVSLNPEKRQRICSEINNEFKQFYRDLSEPKEEATSILSELFPGYSNDQEKINKIPSLYEQYKTYTSAIQRACYPSLEAILDIKGLDLKSNNLAATYKASLIYDWYNINMLTTLDKCQDDWVIKGEAAAYICWKEDIVQVEDEIPVPTVDLETGLPKLDIVKQKKRYLNFQSSRC